MQLYPRYETDISYKYLQQIITILKEPICILGGWAVYFTVNKEITTDQGTSYLGSKDIDLGYHINTKITQEALKKTPIAQTISLLEKHNFKSLSFRYYKNINIQTGQELTQETANTTPAHDMFPIFIDLIVDKIHPLFNQTFKLNPIDEPLLAHVFLNKDNQIKLKEFNKKLILPTPEILLATKIKSIPNRTKDNKKIKDICDIYSLGWYSGIPIKTIKKNINQFITKKEQEITLKSIKSEPSLLEQCQQAMNIDKKTIMNLLNELLK